ncbi:MAG TPA: hypothetical protein VGQ00_00935 [Candidatus Norongarragalinales archaeon]|nr:hypothetical protein [Candidatus Norongarragalinales archaeon]
MALEQWLLYAVAAMLLFSVTNVVLKILVTDYAIHDFSNLTNALSEIKGAALLLLVVAFSLAGIWFMLSALSIGKVAIVSGVLAMGVVLVAVFSYFLLGDRFALKELGALGLALISILLLLF